MRRTAGIFAAMAVLMLAALLRAQGTPPPTPLTLVSRDGRRPVPTTMISGQEFMALDDVAALFQVAVREDALAGGVTVAYRGRTIVISADQPMASVGGRVITLPAPVMRSGRRWLVPIDFLSRALAPVYDQRIELRRPARLLIVGDVRVPRVVARIDAAGPPTRATIEITPAAAVTSAADGNRTLVRIDADALDLSVPAAGLGLIDQLRAGEAPNTLALVTAAGAGVPRIAVTAGDTATRVVIDIPPAATTDSPPPVPPPARPPPAPAAVPEPPAFTPAAAGLRTIVLDPGHGGEDAGARGANGVLEKDVTLDAARRLRGLLESRLGLRVILTRDDDRSVVVDERAALANNSKADLFLSLHANAAPAPALAGAEVFHLRLESEGEDARAAEDTGTPLPVLGGGTRSISVIRWDLAQARHVGESAVLAGMLEEELRKHAPMSPRTVRQAPLRVLMGANMPAALVEMAYLTNPEQAAQARSEPFQNGLAQALFDAVVRFRSHLEQGTRQ